MTRRLSKILAISLAALAVPLAAYAADHTDGPEATADPTADLSDVFAWMADGRLNLVMDVWPYGPSTIAFSDAVQYVFHVDSAPAFGATGDSAQVLCQFYSETSIECWAGDEYVEGDPSDPAGIASATGRMRVFAGRRNDPFFFESDGFKLAVQAVIDAGLGADAAGCPDVDAPTSATLFDLLQHDPGGQPARDTIAGQPVLSIVVQLDPAVVTTGGNVLGVWASTHRAM